MIELVILLVNWTKRSLGAGVTSKLAGCYMCWLANLLAILTTKPVSVQFIY